tara:strand:+ start:1610 stop:1855 length:246 start_codon:yes stop_codon:yes gene_type:complete
MSEKESALVDELQKYLGNPNKEEQAPLLEDLEDKLAMEKDPAKRKLLSEQIARVKKEKVTTKKRKPTLNDYTAPTTITGGT